MAFPKRHTGELFPGPLDANSLGTTIAMLNRRSVAGDGSGVINRLEVPHRGLDGKAIMASIDGAPIGVGNEANNGDL